MGALPVSQRTRQHAGKVAVTGVATAIKERLELLFLVCGAIEEDVINMRYQPFEIRTAVAWHGLLNGAEIFPKG